MSDLKRSRQLIERAARSIPGGVNSPVRAFKGVGGTPVFFESGTGAYLTDVDGNRYVDYVGSWGPMILGHAAEPVLAAVTARAAAGLGFGAPTELEIEMAEKVVALVPGIEQVRMVNSGTEATMSAIRLARAFTRRDLIVKFDGCYHGHADALLVKAGSGVLTLGIPNSPGVPEATAELTLSLPFNDLDAVGRVFADYPGRIACVILEPVAGNMGCVPPVEGFLEGLREITERDGALLIFDEVMTGFRIARGGAQEHYNVTPDLTTLGKVIGGGLPVGAFGGRSEIMAEIAPAGPVYQAGTLSGNPLAMAAGLAMLREVEAEGFHARLGQTTDTLVQGLRAAATRHNVAIATNHVCGMFSLFFTSAPSIRGYQDVASSDVGRFSRFFHAMLDRGVYLAPSAYEAGFVSTAHGEAEIEKTLEAADAAFAELGR